MNELMIDVLPTLGLPMKMTLECFTLLRSVEGSVADCKLFWPLLCSDCGGTNCSYDLTQQPPIISWLEIKLITIIYYIFIFD